MFDRLSDRRRNGPGRPARRRTSGRAFPRGTVSSGTGASPGEGAARVVGTWSAGTRSVGTQADAKASAPRSARAREPIRSGTNTAALQWRCLPRAHSGVPTPTSRNVPTTRTTLAAMTAVAPPIRASGRARSRNRAPSAPAVRVMITTCKASVCAALTVATNPKGYATRITATLDPSAPTPTQMTSWCSRAQRERCPPPPPRRAIPAQRQEPTTSSVPDHFEPKQDCRELGRQDRKTGQGRKLDFAYDLIDPVEDAQDACRLVLNPGKGREHNRLDGPAIPVDRQILN